MARADLPPQACDVAIVGAGILGLGVARELIMRHPRSSICVLERESALGEHQTGNNSGVIHAGIQYAGGSLKAKLCLDGASALYEYCEAHAIPHERCGKVILARDRSELPGLHELFRSGSANGVSGLRLLDEEGVRELEPHAQALAGLHSPETGIVDFGAVARCYADDLRQAGGVLITGCEVTGAEAKRRAITLVHREGATQARYAIFCAGAWSDRLAVAAGADPDPRIVPFKGAYLRLKHPTSQLVRSMIYPVPDGSLPFLGVHLTKSLSGDLLIGPTALLALSRSGPKASGVPFADVKDTLSWPGTWRMFARFWRTGLKELHHAASAAALLKAASRYVPELEAADVEPAFAGVRAQALNRDGRLVDDFVFARTERALHVRNAPSPAATASLAIAKHIVAEAELAFSLSDRR